MHEQQILESPSENSLEAKKTPVEKFLNYQENRNNEAKENLHWLLSTFEKKKFLPRPVLEELDIYIRNAERNLESSGVQESELKRVLSSVVKDRIFDKVFAHRDSRFNIPNFNFLVEVLFEFSSEAKTEQDLKRSGVMFFDVDGLKAVNDMALKGHSSGDDYLHEISKIFTNGKTIHWLEAQGVRVTPARKSGDEFMLAIQDQERDLSENQDFIGVNGEEVRGMSLFSYITSSIKKEIQELDMTKIMDFSLAEQREKYADINASEWPEDFKFQASISGDGSTFLDALIETGDEMEALLERVTRPDDALRKLVGSAVNLSDIRMNIAKARDKKERVSSSDPKERLMEKIYRAGREDKKEEIADLKEKNASLEREKISLEVDNSMLSDERDILRLRNEELKRELEELRKMRMSV